LKKGGYGLATVHRAANTDDPRRMRSLLEALGALSKQIVFPLHPRTQKMIQEWGLTASSNILFMEPQGYFDILVLQENADCILTDSGGMQKEAYWLGVRCITLREETEWVETVSSGWNTLVGVDQDALCTAFETWHPEGERPSFYGDGDSANRICDVLSLNVR
jgi:UDP-N-acetylglucosamine 2-epimerase